MSILRYLSADRAKRPRPYVIGVTVVFILVMVMTMFKSVVESSPVIFVKIGQVEVGCIDFQLRPTDSTSMSLGDMNYYGINPFDNPLCVNDTLHPDRSSCIT